jgi:NAD(P)-dependent dehydrogenase (short-subunit alcohol dehydrogenase family)
MPMAHVVHQAAIAQMTKVLGLQLIGKGIRVNAVAPGPMLTPMNPATMPEENIEKLGKFKQSVAQPRCSVIGEAASCDARRLQCTRIHHHQWPQSGLYMRYITSKR